MERNSSFLLSLPDWFGRERMAGHSIHHQFRRSHLHRLCGIRQRSGQRSEGQGLPVYYCVDPHENAQRFAFGWKCHWYWPYFGRSWSCLWKEEGRNCNVIRFRALDEENAEFSTSYLTLKFSTIIQMGCFQTIRNSLIRARKFKVANFQKLNNVYEKRAKIQIVYFHAQKCKK